MKGAMRLAKFKYYLVKQRHDSGVLLGHCSEQPCQLIDSQRYMFINCTFNALFVF